MHYDRGGLPNGKRISCVTEQIDVTATILITGISPPEMVHGESLFPVMTGEQTSHVVMHFPDADLEDVPMKDIN